MEIKLKALAEGAVDTTLLNVGFSETIKPGFFIALRVLFLPELLMASNVIFAFAAGKKQRLLREMEKAGIRAVRPLLPAVSSLWVLEYG